MDDVLTHQNCLHLNALLMEHYNNHKCVTPAQYINLGFRTLLFERKRNGTKYMFYRCSKILHPWRSDTSGTRAYVVSSCRTCKWNMRTIFFSFAYHSFHSAIWSKNIFVKIFDLKACVCVQWEDCSLDWAIVNETMLNTSLYRTCNASISQVSYIT